MRRWRRRASRVSLVRRTPRPTPGQRDAARALYRAQCAREEARARRPEVDETVGRLRQVRQANHFEERFRLALEGDG